MILAAAPVIRTLCTAHNGSIELKHDTLHNNILVRDADYQYTIYLADDSMELNKAFYHYLRLADMHDAGGL